MGLEEELIEKKEVCMTEEQPQLVLSEIRRNFDDTQAFCEVLGGEIADVNENATRKEIIEAFKSQDKFDKCSLMFFTGYIKQDGEGKFKNINTGEVMEWPDLGEGHPGQNYCTVYHTENIHSEYCLREYCSVCRIQRNME